jgi:serine/threonine-protein kinase
LHAAHELIGDDGRPLDVVHRDVSPHNILVTTEGQIKVTDFGVAKALGKSHMTVAGQLKGKLAYMSPEQLMGGAVDRRADVFALGCVLYEITTGRQPFVGEHDPQVMAQIMMGHYELPSTSMPGYPPELEAIVERALGSDPDLRYPTAEHMRQALEAYLRTSGPPVTSIQVADLVQQRCGRQIEERAARLFEAPAGASPQHGSAPRAVVVPMLESIRGHDATAEIVGPERPTRSSLLLPFALAALLGAGLGLAVVGYMYHTQKEKATLLPPVATAPISPAPPSPHAEATARPPSPSPPARQNAVHLHVAPDSAILIVGSVVLPPGARSIVRPEDGGSLHVLVRADKYEDEIFIVDSHTADDVDIELTPARPRLQFGGASGTAGRTKNTDAGAKDASGPPSGTNGTEGKPKPNDNGTDEGPAHVPPNPYQDLR